jgi:NAD(P)-dependent dehydrogenase (short-subunit alcohol dehydrogenase family)
MAEFAGKVALVTGGSSGIGRATAIAFAHRGAKVVVSARGAERGQEVVDRIKADGGEAAFVAADMSKPVDIDVLVRRTVELYGRVDFGFNNAASDHTGLALTADITEAEFDYTMAVNLKGIWLCMKWQIQQMLRQQPPGGAIVNTSSINGLGGVAGGSIYAASKAGIIALTKSAAQEYAGRGIRVNSLVCGAFKTPMLESVFDIASGGDAAVKHASIERIKQLIPQHRIAEPHEAAEAAVWLCSDRASYVTGHSMIVDGGLTSPHR